MDSDISLKNNLSVFLPSNRANFSDIKWDFLFGKNAHIANEKSTFKDFQQFLIHKLFITHTKLTKKQNKLLTLSLLRRSPLMSKILSGVRHSKICKCQLALTGVKGLKSVDMRLYGEAMPLVSIKNSFR